MAPSRNSAETNVRNPVPGTPLSMPNGKSMSQSSLRPILRGSHPYAECVPVVATIHQKERAIAPAFRRHLGLPVITFASFDTDNLGTFTGEIPRTGTMLDAAIEKARIASAKTGRRLGIGSEGSFGTHPNLPFLAADTEVIVLFDRDLNITIADAVTVPRTNFALIDIEYVDQIEEFLKHVGFPRHAVIVRLTQDRKDSPIYKGLIERSDAVKAIDELNKSYPGELVRISTDMRAHFNPTRMSVIRTVATRLARRLAILCPNCGTPGFGVLETVRGLPCSVCECPTDRTKTLIHGCKRCTYRKMVPANAHIRADPRYCPDCNP